MTKKKHLFLERFKRALPYILAGGAVLALVAVGSLDKQSTDANLSLDTFANNDYNV